MANIHEAKARISEYIEAALRGEQVVLCNRNRPLVELRPVVSPRTSPRPLGDGPYRFDVSNDVFAPMVVDEVADWDRGRIAPDDQGRSSRVAEIERPYGKAPRKPKA